MIELRPLCGAAAVIEIDKLYDDDQVFRVSSLVGPARPVQVSFFSLHRVSSARCITSRAHIEHNHAIELIAHACTHPFSLSVLARSSIDIDVPLIRDVALIRAQPHASSAPKPNERKTLSVAMAYLGHLRPICNI